MSSETIVCDCKGYEYRESCKHATAIAKALSTGATFGFPIAFRSLTNPKNVYTINRIVTGQEAEPLTYP